MTNRFPVINISASIKGVRFIDTIGREAVVFQVASESVLHVSDAVLDQEMARNLAWTLIGFANNGRIEGPSRAQQAQLVYDWLKSMEDVAAMDDGDLIDALRNAVEAGTTNTEQYDNALTELIDRFMSSRGILETPSGEKSMALIKLED